MPTRRRRLRAVLRACLREAGRSMPFAMWWFPPALPMPGRDEPKPPFSDEHSQAGR